MTDTFENIVQPYLIDSGMSRGQAVRLTSVLDTIIGQHGYPESVGKFLSEAAVLTALLASSVKYDGVFSLQIQGDGAISMLVIDLTATGQMRGYARFDEAALKQAEQTPDEQSTPVSHYFGNGTLAFMTEHDGTSYQGVVALEKASLTDCVLEYFRQSEQIDTEIRLATASPDDKHGWIAGAALLQKMPFDAKTAERLKKEEADDLWNTATVLLKSLQDSEILDTTLSLEKMLFRLFYLNDLHFFIPKQIEFGCRCSKEKVIEMLKRFSPQERKEMPVDGVIKIDCRFCGKSYTVTLQDLGE